MTEWIDRCHFGDCRELMPLLPEAIADAIVTDPPYGDTSLLWDKRCTGWTDHIARVLKPAAAPLPTGTPSSRNARRFATSTRRTNGVCTRDARHTRAASRAAPIPTYRVDRMAPMFAQPVSAS